MTEEEKKALEAQKAAEEAAKVAEDEVADTLIKTYADLEKARIERDNYRDGLLKAKGKKPDDETDDERIERIVNEKIASSQVGSLLKDFQGKLAEVVKKNKELTIANRAKNSMDSKIGGGNQDGQRDTKKDPLDTVPANLRDRISKLSEASQKKIIDKWKAAGVIR